MNDTTIIGLLAALASLSHMLNAFLLRENRRLVEQNQRLIHHLMGDVCDDDSSRNRLESV